MFIQVEPADFFMYTVRLIFDLEHENTEDPLVRDYLLEHELEPKYQWTAELEDSQCEFMQFGGCYLGRHLDKIGQIQRQSVEQELLTGEVEAHLESLRPEESPIGDTQRQATIAALVETFNQESSFEVNDRGELTATLEGDAVREEAKRLLSKLQHTEL